MAYITKEFDSYSISYYSGHPQEAIINCFKANGLVGRMVFYKEGTSIPPNTNPSYGPSLNYSMSRFPDVMGILLHEKPLKLLYDTTYLMGYLETGSYEPIGEEETTVT